MGRLHDGSGNSHRGAVAPFLDHRPHIVITPCIYIAATFCQEFRSCVNNVDTVRELCKNPTFSVHWGYLLSESRFPDLLETSFVLCKQGVTGSIPVTSTNFLFCLYRVSCLCATAFESA